METRHWRTIPGFVRIGSTGKTRGIRGEIKLYIDDRYLDDVLNAEFLFLELKGNKVPLHVESLREVQDLLVKFDKADNPTDAAQYTSVDVFLPVDEIAQVEIEDDLSHLEYGNLIGFEIHDLQLGNVGQIIEVREFPQQEMAVLKVESAERLVPLNPVFILHVDTERKTIEMDLPDGLLGV